MLSGGTGASVSSFDADFVDFYTKVGPCTVESASHHAAQLNHPNVVQFYGVTLNPVRQIVDVRECSRMFANDR